MKLTEAQKRCLRLIAAGGITEAVDRPLREPAALVQAGFVVRTAVRSEMAGSYIRLEATPAGRAALGGSRDEG